MPISLLNIIPSYLRSIPSPSTWIRGLWLLLATFLIAVTCSGCSGDRASPIASLRPDFLPVAFGIGPSGITIQGNKSFVTPIGVFSIGATYDLLPRNTNEIYVILRDQRTGFDHIYKVQTGVDEFSAVINGTTSIAINNGQVLIDITNGNIKHIAFKQIANQVPEGGDINWLGRMWHNSIGRWILIIFGIVMLLRILRRY